MKNIIILSTGNENKVNEIKEILSDMPYEVVSKNEIGYEDLDVIEDKDTLEDNAFKKVMELSKVVKGTIIADDTGLYVDALNGAPGVYSARYAGENADDRSNNDLLLKNLNGVVNEKRTALFKTVIAVLMENGEKIKTEGICRGSIAFEEKGKNGFGYDSLFIVEGTNKTFAEMTEEEKNKISHRSIALYKLKEILKEALY